MRYRFAAVLAVATISLATVAACTGSQTKPSSASRSPAAQKSTAPSVSNSASVSPNSASVAPASAAGCAGQPPVTPLPAWVRAGFTPPDTAMPHVVGENGNIVAILWVTPDALRVPALANRANKILWVSRVSSGPMTIRATLAGGTRTATVNLPDGPGPSYVNMPAPGCWTMHLSWAGHTDQLSLRYVR